jgi:hypothetical protein
LNLHVSQDTPDNLQEIRFSDKSGVNVPVEVLFDQVRENVRLGLPQCKPHPPNSDTVALVCGGPSLKQTEAELVEAVWRGAKVVAMNGSYQWCIDHNIKPSAMVMLDARAFNTRFLETPVPSCKYLLAGQCHPEAFEMCRNRETYIWHAACGQEELDFLDEFYFSKYHAIGIGTTVALRAISLMRMLGFQSFDVFGLDSCWLDAEHHAYQQGENDEDELLSVWTRPVDHPDFPPKRFLCSPWHVKQAQDIQHLIKARGNFFRLNVRGSGLIAYIIKTCAEIGTDEPSAA